MDEHLKQRLVGALVLLSAAVIFLPLVFDGREDEESYRDVQIPEEPVVTLDVTEPAIDSQYFASVQQTVESQREQAAQGKPASESEVPDPSTNEAAGSDTPAPITPAKRAEEASAREDFAAIKAASQAPVSGTDRLAENYTIQLAAFSSKENAEKLHKQLIEKSYNAYIEPSSNNGKTLYRVFVGPLLRKSRAEAIANALHKEFKLKGLVVRYAP